MNAPSVSETQLPLVLGVTGHRNLEENDCDALRDKVRGIFAEIRRDFPQTPLLLLSALAEGADRLVAEIASEKGIAVVAPLPMPRRLYENDFADPSRREFADWLDNKVRCWFELPLVEGNTETSIAEDGPARNKQYAYVGEYIARHSQVLIALWDGQPGKDGGTQQVFDYKKDGFPILPGSPRGSRLESVEAALLYHVVSPRQGQPRPADALDVKKICTAEEDKTDRQSQLVPAATHETFRRIFAPVERFNLDRERFAVEVEPLRQQSRLYLLGEEKSSSLPAALAPSGASLGLRPFVERFTLTDSLAICFQRRMFRSLAILYVLIFFAMLFFEVCAHEVIEYKWLLLGFVFLLMAAYVWHWRARRLDDQNRYQDYRALAEGMRVQLFRRLAGLHELHSPVADHYLLKHATDLDWIRNALRTWSSSWSFPEARGFLTIAETPPADLAFVREHWLQDQLKFFEGRSERFQRREERLQFWSKHSVSILSVLVVLVVVIAWSIRSPRLDANHPPEKSIELNLALLLVSALLLTTALMHEYISRLALTEHAKTYRRMAALFRKADTLLEEYIQTNDMAAAQEVIQRLGREALVENGDWLLLHRDRPVNVPNF